MKKTRGETKENAGIYKKKNKSIEWKRVVINIVDLKPKERKIAVMARDRMY